MTPAELNALLISQMTTAPQYDAAGRCLHVRAIYKDFGSMGRDWCPDCGDIKWGDDWTRGKNAVGAA